MIPLAMQPPNGVMARYCPTCDVAWARTEPLQCWICGTSATTLRALSSWRNAAIWKAALA
jgi:hypothetical protein